jgi:general secretion pathway protein M
MKPSSTNLKGSPYSLSIVEMKINNLTMEQLVNFLQGVETSQDMIWVKRVSLAKGEKEGQLIDAVLQVETFQL